MRILVYKQTHIGDPSKMGLWGQTDCMGRVRGLRYDAVIGVGGTSAWPRAEGIAAKVTWAALQPSMQQHPDMRGPLVSFQRFSRLEDQGPLVSTVAPALARRIYERRTRYLILSGGREHAEAKQLISILLRKRVPPDHWLKPTCPPPLRCGGHAA